MVSLVSNLNGGLLSRLFPTLPVVTGVRGLTHAVNSSPLLVDAHPSAISRDQVIVVRGHDHIERVLDKFGVSSTLVSSNRINDPLLAGAKYLFVNCGAILNPGVPQRIAEWVKAGGRLMTTDWMVRDILQEVFFDEERRPLVRQQNALSADKSDFVTVSQFTMDDPAVRLFLDDGSRVFWWVRSGSCPIAVTDPQRVHVLARLSGLGRLFELEEPIDVADPLAVRFDYGRGQVLHLMSDWYPQEFDEASQDSVSSKRPPFITSII